MSWRDLRTEVDSMFRPLVVVNTDLEDPDVFFMPMKTFAPDRHLDADRFLAANDDGRARIRDDFATAAAARKANAKKWTAPIMRRYEVTLGRNLEQKSGKVTPAVKAQIVELATMLSDRKIALRLKLSRLTVARALGKPWARDPRAA